MKLNGNLTFKTLGDELRNAIIERLGSDPGTTVEGRLYYNTTDNEYRYYNGTGWQPFGEGVIASNMVTASGGIYDTDGTYDGSAVDTALSNVTGSTDLLNALTQLDQAVSGAAESYRIKDADTDTIVRTAATGGGDEDEVEIILGDNGDSKGPETVATFGRASTAIKGLDATAGNTAGSAVSLTGGAGNADGYGGDVTIDGGVGYYGGRVDVAGGSATTLNGGGISITGGSTASVAQYGGDVTITGGTGNGYGGGRVFIDGGSGLKDGDVYITSGGTSLQTQRINLFGSADDGDTAGNIEILGADSALSASAGASIDIAAGDGGATGDGGSINLSVHAGTTNDGIISISSTDALAPELRFLEATGSEYVAMHAPDAITTSVTYTLPVSPTAGYVLQTTALGVLSWVDPSGVTSLALDDLTDTNVASPTDNDLLQWDNGTSRWIDSAIGSDAGVQAYDAGLDSLAGLSASSGDVIYATAADTYAVAQPGSTSGVQGHDDGLDSIAGLAASNGDIIYATAADTYAVAAPGATSGVQAYDANLDQIAALTPTTDNFIVGGGSAWTLETPADARTSLGLVAGGTGDIWIEKAGDAMDSAANISFSGGGEVTGLPATPSGATAATSKEYVDQIVASGTVWEDPITDPDLVGISSTADPSADPTTTWIAYGGSYPQTWGSITDVAERDVLERNATDDDWIRLSAVLSDGRFIISGDHGTFGITDALYTTAELRSKDLVQWVVGSTDPTLAASWTRPHNGAYQVIDFSTIKTGASSTGFANDATVYVIDVRVDTTTYNVAVVGSAAQTIATLITEINTDLTGATAVLDATGGHIHIGADDDVSEILITHTAVGGTDMTTALTDFLEIRGGVTNGTTVLVNDPDSTHFGDQFHYSDQNNNWTLIGGPSSVQAGTGLSKSGTVLSVNMGSGIVELPSDQVGVDLRNNSSGALLLTTDGITREGTNAASQLWLRLAGDDTSEAASGLTQDGEGLRIVLSTNSGLTLTGAGTVNGTLEVAPKTSTGIAINGGDGELELTAIPNASLTNSDITFGDGTNTDAVALGETQTATGAIVGANTIKYRRIEDADSDTYLQTSSSVSGDQDIIVGVLGEATNLDTGHTAMSLAHSQVTLAGANSTSASAAGGAVTIQGGEGYGVNLGGTVNITGGYGDEGTNAGANILLAGSSDTIGGPMVLSGGYGATGVGGQVGITGGNSASVGGNLYLGGGNGTSTSGGSVTITPGTGAADGFVILKPPSGSSDAVSLRFEEAGVSTDYIALETPTPLASSITYTLPISPADGYLMSTNSSGVMSWIDPTTVGATRLEDLADVTAATSGSPQDSVGNILVADGVDSYDTQSVQFNYDSTLNGGASTSHTVTHSLGQRFVNVTVFDSSYNQVIPQTVVLTDTNTVTVTFNSSIQCYVVVMGIPGVALA